MNQKADTILRGTENEADANVSWYVVDVVITTAGYCWHIRTMSGFNKRNVNIYWFTLSDYNCIAWFCSISSTKIVSNKLNWAAAHLHSNTAFRFWMNLRLNESSESIKLLIHKDSDCPSPNVHTIHPKCDISHFYTVWGQIGWIVCTLGRRDLLCSWMNQPFERINWMNNSVIKSVTCRHLMAVLVSFLKYNFSYLNHWTFLYSKCYI